MKKTTFGIFCLVFVLGISALDAAGQTRIRFLRGRTSASVTAMIGRSAQRKYVLRARNGQNISATVSSRNGCVVLGNETTSETYTTDRGDNWINIFNRCSSPTRFTLTVSIY